jgi:hypothetical protein
MYETGFLRLPLGVGTVSNAGYASSALRSGKPDAELDESAKMAVLQHLGLADDGKQGASATRQQPCSDIVRTGRCEQLWSHKTLTFVTHSAV